MINFSRRNFLITLLLGSFVVNTIKLNNNKEKIINYKNFYLLDL